MFSPFPPWITAKDLDLPSGPEARAPLRIVDNSRCGRQEKVLSGLSLQPSTRGVDGAEVTALLWMVKDSCREGSGCRDSFNHIPAFGVLAAFLLASAQVPCTALLPGLSQT